MPESTTTNDPAFELFCDGQGFDYGSTDPEAQAEVRAARLAWNAALASRAAIPDAAQAPSEDAYVAQRMSELMAEVYGIIIGDDARPEDEALNAIERVTKAAQVLRLEVDLYRAQRHADAAQAPITREAATVPEGFALVPVVMTAAMINAWSGGLAVTTDEVAVRTPFQDAWKRVLAASSKAPPRESEGES